METTRSDPLGGGVHERLRARPPRVEIVSPEHAHLPPSSPVLWFAAARFNAIAAPSDPAVAAPKGLQRRRNLARRAQMLVVVRQAVVSVQQSPLVLQVVVELRIGLVVGEQWRHPRKRCLQPYGVLNPSMQRKERLRQPLRRRRAE